LISITPDAAGDAKAAYETAAVCNERRGWPAAQTKGVSSACVLGSPQPPSRKSNACLLKWREPSRALGFSASAAVMIGRLLMRRHRTLGCAVGRDIPRLWRRSWRRWPTGFRRARDKLSSNFGLCIRPAGRCQQADSVACGWAALSSECNATLRRLLRY